MATTRRDSAFADSKQAAADLSAKLYYLATLNSSKKYDICGTQGIVAGVIVEGTVADGYTTVSCGPIEKVIAGGTVAAGERVESDSAGKAVAGTTAPFGVAQESAVSGDIFAVKMDRS